MLEAFEMASLLSSRLCHDLVSPVGAVTNGLEVLAEETEPEMRDSAMRLITESADRAARKLQFARLAYGAGGGPQAVIDIGEAGRITAAMLNDIKVALDWRCSLPTAGRMISKLFVNMAFLAAEALPRGGKVTADLSVEGATSQIKVLADGPMLKPMAQMVEIVNGDAPLAGLAPRAAQAYYAGLIARCLGGRIEITMHGQQLVIAGVFTSA